MPPEKQGLVATHGSRGVPMLGGQMNASLTDSILQIASSEIDKNIIAVKAAQYIEGRARVAQGESLETIRASQGVYDKIFGRGTMDGAAAQTVVQATDSHILHMQTNMHKYKEMSTEAFVAEQTDYVTTNLLTGDPGTDNLITLSSAEAIADSSRIHAKEHELFKQQKNKLAFEDGLGLANHRLHNIISNPKMAFDDKVVALHNLVDRARPLPGQHRDAYQNSLYETAISELVHDRPELYLGLRHGAVVIDEEVVETGDPIDFGLEKNAALKQAFMQYRGRVDVDAKVQHGMDLAELTLLSENDEVPDPEVAVAAKVYLSKYGADDQTVKQVEALFLDRGRRKLKKDTTAEDVAAWHSGESMTAVWEQSKKEQIANLHEVTVLDKANATEDPVERERAVVNANKFVLQRAVQNRTVPSTWSARWNHAFENPSDVIDKNKLAEGFAESLQHFNSKYEADKDLFESGLTEKARANMLAVKSIIQTEGATMEQAVALVSSWDIEPVKATELVKTGEFKAQVDEFLDNPSDRFWSEMDVENEVQVRGVFKQLIINQVARTGKASEQTWEAVVATFKKTHEKVENRQVNNQGVPLNQQAGINDPSVSFNDALTHFVRNDRGPAGWRQTADKIVAGILPAVDAPKFQALFGEGADPDNYHYKFDPGYVTITPMDENGGYLLGSDNAGKRIPLRAIGKIYNVEVTGESIDRRISSAKAADEAMYFDSLEQGGVTGVASKGLEANRNAVEHVKGAPVIGSAIDERILKNLKDPVREPQISSLLKSVTTQLGNGDLNGALRTMMGISRLTEDTPQEGDDE